MKYANPPELMIIRKKGNEKREREGERKKESRRVPPGIIPREIIYLHRGIEQCNVVHNPEWEVGDTGPGDTGIMSEYTDEEPDTVDMLDLGRTSHID